MSVISKREQEILLLISNGNYEDQFSYEPCLSAVTSAKAEGRRRNPSNWTYASGPQPVLIDRGFTGHEHLDIFGLIDMNGRMYDPVLGRFLGVDPIIQDAGNSQSINGYGYCLNNPLSYVDPSGYSYLQTLQQTYNYEGGGFWYRGDYYSWSDDYGFGGGFSNSSGYLLNSGTYSYNASTNQYYDGYGRKVDFREVLHEYIIPIGVEIDWMTITGTKSNPYQHIGWVYYTDGTKANWDMDIDQSWNLPVSMNSAPPSNVGWVADMTGKICAGVLEFAIGFLGGAEVGLVRSAFTKSGTNVVYQGLDAAGVVRYIGITERAPAVRWLEHVKSGTARSLLDYRVIEGATNLTRTEARVWEQTLINQYGLSKNGGLLLNKINSIAPRYWWQYGINP